MLPTLYGYIKNNYLPIILILTSYFLTMSDLVSIVGEIIILLRNGSHNEIYTKLLNESKHNNIPLHDLLLLVNIKLPQQDKVVMMNKYLSSPLHHLEEIKYLLTTCLVDINYFSKRLFSLLPHHLAKIYMESLTYRAKLFAQKCKYFQAGCAIFNIPSGCTIDRLTVDDYKRIFCLCNNIESKIIKLYYDSTITANELIELADYYELAYEDKVVVDFKTAKVGTLAYVLKYNKKIILVDPPANVIKHFNPSSIVINCI